MIKLIKNGEVYAPEKLGKCSILLINNKIIKIGQFHEKNLDSIGLEYEVIDAQNSIITPGFIDPHVHIIGGGEKVAFPLVLLKYSSVTLFNQVSLLLLVC